MVQHEDVERVTRAALESGALEPIDTTSRLLDDAGLPYVVRVVAALGRKPRALATPARAPASPVTRPVPAPPERAEPNPFLPYDPRLFVADVAPAHVVLLNKFPVIAHHLLVVTRRFEEQSALLTLADFEALARSMAGIGGLGFYNGGIVAGASQRHKHLQLVPLPLEPAMAGVPFEPLFARASHERETDRVPALPFDHRFAWLDGSAEPSGPDARGRRLHEIYRHMLDALGLATEPGAAYNLLCTDRWMLVVPREREHFGTISVNALGFVGGLLARDEQELAMVEQAGVRRVLAEVARRP